MDDGRVGRVPFAVSDGDFSTPARRRRTITRPRGLRALEAPVVADALADALMDETRPAPEPDSAASLHQGEGEPGLSAVDEFLTSPPTPAPEIELTPLPETEGTGLAISEMMEGELTPAAGSLNVAVLEADQHAETTPPPQSASAAPDDFGLEEDPGAVVGATPLPEVPIYTHGGAPIGATVTPAPDARTLSRDAHAHFSAHDTAEAELDAAVDAAIPTFPPSTPATGSVPIIENASAGEEMRLAALGSLPVAREMSPDVDQVARDEAIVDELLRRATEQMLGGGEVPEGELPAAALTDGLPEVEAVLDETPAAAEVSVLQTDGLATVFDAAPAEEIEESSAEVIEEPSTEPSLSPLAQTLANMAESLHSDLGTDGGIEIDIVDAPLVSPPPVPPIPEHAISPPPIPQGVVPAAKAVAEAPVVEDSAIPEALEERPRRPRRSKPWYEEVFDENYLRTLPFMTPEQTLREVDFIEASLAAEKGARALDIGCGYGRHAIELVQRGLAVTGLDLSLPLLIRAADEAQKRALSVNFVHSDMRGLAFDREFDSAYCMLTSFGYFDEESNLKVAEGIARALKPGGRFLLDVVNRDYIVGDLPARIWWEGDGCVVLEEVEFNFNTSRILTHRSVVFEDGRQLDQEISVRAYSLHELGKLLRQTGFRVTEVSGSIYTPGRFFGAASRNLIVLAERRRD
ncbi:MAG TPA: methyltransferase domain-containing protein [Polyangia bacterium]